MSDPKIDKAKGKFKETVGKISGNKRMETEGQIEQASASTREKVAEVKDAVAEAVGNVLDRAGAVAQEIKDKVSGKD